MIIMKDINGKYVNVESDSDTNLAIDTNDCIAIKTFSAVVENTFAQNAGDMYDANDIIKKKRFVAECIRSGITQIFDVSPNYILSANVYKDFDLDVCIGITLYPQDDITNEYIDNCVNRVLEIGDKTEIAIVLENVVLYNEEQISVVVNYAKNNDLYIYTNVSQTLDEVGECDKLIGMSPIYYLESLGILDRKCILGGCVYLDKDEIELLKSYDVSVCVLPTKNMYLGDGIAPIYSILNHGLHLCVGITDQTSPDIFKEMHLINCSQSGILNIANAVDKHMLFECFQNPIIQTTYVFDDNCLRDYFVVEIKDYVSFVSDDWTKMVDHINKENVVYVVKNSKLCYKKCKNC